MSRDPKGRDVVAVLRQSSPNYGISDDSVYFPVNHGQVGDLLGKILTHLDAMVLPDLATKAARTLLIQEIWRWWNGIYENATTSSEGCIAPIVVNNDDGRYVEGEPSSNRWGWQSERQWLQAQAPEPADPKVGNS